MGITASANFDDRCQARLQDVLDAIDTIDRYTQQGKTAFESQELIQVWVVHHCEIIGEAAPYKRYLSYRLNPMKFKSLVVLCLMVVALSLTACISPIAGLKAFVNTSEGYRFLYPNGWVQVQMTRSAGSPDVVFRDLINETENVSVVMSPFAAGDHDLDRSLESLGTPGEVGYLLQQKAIAPPGSGRTAELVDAESREVSNKTYYILEYEVTLPDQKRHDIASVVVSRGKLYTFNASTTEDRWQRVKSKFKTIVESFSVAT